MPANHFTVSLTTGTPIRLGAGLSGYGSTEIAKFISIQADAANAAVVFVGGNQRTVSSSDYGYRIEIPVSSIPYAPTVIEMTPGGVSLNDIFVLGNTNDKIHVFIVI